MLETPLGYLMYTPVLMRTNLHWSVSPKHRQRETSTTRRHLQLHKNVTKKVRVCNLQIGAHGATFGLTSPQFILILCA